MPMPYTVAAALRVKKKHVAEFTRLVKRHASQLDHAGSRAASPSR